LVIKLNITCNVLTTTTTGSHTVEYTMHIATILKNESDNNNNIKYAPTVGSPLGSPHSKPLGSPHSTTPLGSPGG
jgi:hypothetical protein